MHDIKARERPMEDGGPIEAIESRHLLELSHGPRGVVPHQLRPEDPVRRRSEVVNDLQVVLPISSFVCSSERAVLPTPPAGQFPFVDGKEVLVRATGDASVREGTTQHRRATALARTDHVGRCRDVHG
jgi:hypothetical protein